MRERVEVAIVGGGMAGSALAALLSRAGRSVVLCDPRETYPADFRAEKLSPVQAGRLTRMGFGDILRLVTTPIGELSIARFGRIVERRCDDELAFDYADLVNALRAKVPLEQLRVGRVAGIEAGAGGQIVRLSGGKEIEARLVVIATGLARGLIDALGLRRTIVAPDHSLAIGFDVALALPAAGPVALTYHGERAADRAAYLTIFPLGARLRGNLFVYRRQGEEWAAAFRARPAETLRAMMPGLAQILGGFEVVGRPVLRPIALQVTEDPLRDGLVLIGDAFATTCPTGGNGLDKVLTDVERLVALVPGWLDAGDTGAAAVARFYDDPAKRACDADAQRMIAYARAMALDPGLAWRARRWRNFLIQIARGWVRRAAPALRAAKATHSTRRVAEPLDG